MWSSGYAHFTVMMAYEFDVIVVGAGVEGSATAYSLVKAGAGRVLLLEQFSALHSRGSSHGGSRITRRVYQEPFYVHMMDEAFKLWEHIENESKTQLYIKTGILVFGHRHNLKLRKMIESLIIHSVDHEVFTAEEAMLRYPHQLTLPSDYKCVLERDGGILPATKAVGSLQKLFVEFGGEFLDHCQVTHITPGDTITMTTSKGSFTAKKLVITAGPWAPAIMAKLGLKFPFKFNIRRSEVFYWKTDRPEHYSSKVFPVFAVYGEEQLFYGLPIFEYPGLVKICPHASVVVIPDSRDETPSPVVKDIKPIVAKYFKGVSTTPSIYEPCILTKTPDENPILDRHPQYPNIVFGAAFSGHGFKLAPVVGKILTELTLDLPLSYDLTPFKMNRFSQSSSKL